MYDRRVIPLHESCIPKKDSYFKINHKISLSAIWQTIESSLHWAIRKTVSPRLNSPPLHFSICLSFLPRKIRTTEYI